jgi:hypothetical protein
LVTQTYIEPPYVTISGFEGVALYELPEDHAPLKFPPIPTPVAPVRPVAPLGPVGPVDPDGPVGPVEPDGPVGPVEPDGPVGPVEPDGPVVPISPMGLKWISCIVTADSVLFTLNVKNKGSPMTLAVLRFSTPAI